MTDLERLAELKGQMFLLSNGNRSFQCCLNTLDSLSPNCRGLVCREIGRALQQIMEQRFETCDACGKTGWYDAMVKYLESDKDAIVGIFHKECVPVPIPA